MSVAHRLRAIGRRARRIARHPATRTIVACCAVVGGLGLVLVAAAVGHCSFAGGTCPADPVPVWDDDVFGTAATGLVLAVAVPLLARWPDRRGVRAAALGSLVCLPLGWLIAQAAHRGSW